TGRYAPAAAWRTIWKWILGWASRGSFSGELKWTPLVTPRFRSDEPLPENAEEAALRDGVEWFRESRLLVHPAWAEKFAEAEKYHDRVWDGPGEDWPVGDGREGLLEGFSSRIDENGRQKIRWYLRGDCNVE